MSVADVFKNSFLEGFSAMNLTFSSMIICVAITCLFSTYVFMMYRIVTRKTFYDKNMDISLAVIPVIVCSIVLALQASLVVSLGMVGALSIVRFRTAIKNPLDLVFLFWSVSVGIICGAGIPNLALLLSIVVTLGIGLANICPVAKAPVLLLVNADSAAAKDEILSVVKRNAYSYTVKSHAVEMAKLSMVIEIRIHKDNHLLEEMAALSHIVKCSLIQHDGEVSF